MGRKSIAVYFFLIQTTSIVHGSTSVSVTTPGSASTSASNETPPPRPLNVSVEPDPSLKLNVSWTPADHGSASYYIFVNESYIHHTNETVYVIDSNLTYGEFYIIGVKACKFTSSQVCSDATNSSSATYPAIPRFEEVIGQGVDYVHLELAQLGGFSSLNVTVNYYNVTNVSNNISVSPLSETGNFSHQIDCNITHLPTAGGQYTLVASAEFMGLRSGNMGHFIYTVPEMPGNMTLINQTTSEICVEWTQLGNAFGFIVHVNDTISPNASFVPSSNNDSSAECLKNCTWTVKMCISGLNDAGELYKINVTAEVETLSSAWQTSLQATAPFGAKSLSCSNQSTTSLTILIGPPTEGKYEHFLIEYSSLVNGYPNNGSSETAENKTNLANLTAGVMYMVEVKTQSHDVDGVSIATNCTTIPNAPLEFSSSTMSANSIRLIWKNPDGYFSEYDIVYTNGSHESTESIAASSSSHDLVSLSSDCQYKVTIFTRNFNVRSANVTSSNYTFPDAVRDINFIDKKENEVNVSWKPPENHINIFLYEVKLLDNSGGCSRKINVTCSDKTANLSQWLSSDGCSSSNESITCEKENAEYSVRIPNLKHSTSYNVSIAAVNPGGKGIASIMGFMTSIPGASSDWIAGVVVGCILGVLLIVAALLLHRWRNNKPPFSSQKSTFSESDRDGQENLTFEEEPEPVPIQDFANHVTKMNMDSNYRFACEYTLLGKLSPKNPTHVAESPENRAKNRYTDVLPFDDSRVKLLIPEDYQEEGELTDYINASYLPGFNSKREYIAAQGPMRSTVTDFWLMIWQQKVTTIVMVTNLFERGREKCEQYWPSNNDPIVHGDVSVEMKSESTLDYYTLRVMEVSVKSEKRQLNQYHFLTWPDFGVPDDIAHILSFVTDVRSNFRGKAPMLVHCSAGVGRTGTFIVVDHLLQLIKREQLIDLFHLVLDLRQHRPKMIQAESQYIFAHECIKMAISQGYHMRNSMLVAENDLENGNCLYVNVSDLVADDPPLYVNAGEFREQPV